MMARPGSSSLDYSIAVINHRPVLAAGPGSSTSNRLASRKGSRQSTGVRFAALRDRLEPRRIAAAATSDHVETRASGLRPQGAQLRGAAAPHRDSLYSHRRSSPGRPIERDRLPSCRRGIVRSYPPAARTSETRRVDKGMSTSLRSPSCCLTKCASAAGPQARVRTNLRSTAPAEGLPERSPAALRPVGCMRGLGVRAQRCRLLTEPTSGSPSAGSRHPAARRRVPPSDPPAASLSGHARLGER